MFGIGNNHGEGVEQNWDFTNGAAASTRKMGLGSRFAVLEDIFGFHNWRREIAMSKLFGLVVYCRHSNNRQEKSYLDDWQRQLLPAINIKSLLMP
jgi:hypothetical protein